MELMEYVLDRYWKVSRFLSRKDSFYKNARLQSAVNEAKLKAGISKEQRDALWNLLDAQFIANEREVETAFSYGFQMGVQLSGELNALQARFQEGEKQLQYPSKHPKIRVVNRDKQ